MADTDVPGAEPKEDFMYVAVNASPLYAADEFARAAQDPAAVLMDPALTTTLTLRIDRKSLGDIVLASGDSPTPHAIERWSDDCQPALSLLNPVCWVPGVQAWRCK